MDTLDIMKSNKAYASNHFSMPNELQTPAKNLCIKFNNTLDDETEIREEILNELLGTRGSAVIMPPFYCDYGFNIHFEGFALLNYNIVMLDTSPINIGNGCFIGPGCVLSCAGHAIHPSQRMKYLTSAPITLEEGVWIGANVTICAGVTIGKGSVIGAGSVVNKDIPQGVIAAGSPCKVIREISDEDIIKEEDILIK